MLTFESLPVELISDTLGETDIETLIGVSLYAVCRCSGYLNSASLRNSCVGVIPQITRSCFRPWAQPLAPSNPTQTSQRGVWDGPREPQPPHDRPKAQLDRDHEQSASRVSAV